MRDITDKQKQVLFFIKDFIKNNKFPPTVREIAAGFSVRKQATTDILVALEKKGFITRVPTIARGIVINRKGKRVKV